MPSPRKATVVHGTPPGGARLKPPSWWRLEYRRPDMSIRLRERHGCADRRPSNGPDRSRSAAEFLDVDPGHFFADGPPFQIHESPAKSRSVEDPLRRPKLVTCIADPAVRSGILKIAEERAAAAHPNKSSRLPMAAIVVDRVIRRHQNPQSGMRWVPASIGSRTTFLSSARNTWVS